MGGSEAGCDMGFHVDGESAGRHGERPLIRLRHDRQIDAREIAEAGFGQAGGQTLPPGRISRPALAASDNRPGEDRRAGGSVGSRPPAMPKLRMPTAPSAMAASMRRGSRGPPAARARTPGPLAIAASRARPETARINPGAPAQLTAHSPYSTARVLPLVRLR